MKNKYSFFLAFITLAFFTNVQVNAQTSEPASPFKATAELVSHYVWRGSMATGSPTPNFQPTLAFTKGNFEIGVWGSTDFVGSYKELDPYVSYGVGPWKFTLTDYNWNFVRANYFNYKNSETGHMFEGSIGYTGPSSLPVTVSLNTMFYGFDQKGNGNLPGYKSNASASDSANQAYSTYIELGYTKGMASFFFGFTPMASYYNNYGVTKWDATADKKSFSIVNIGATISRSIKITESFSLPVRATLILNPSATYSRNDYLHLVFGITF
jgi:hypothetical protein